MDDEPDYATMDSFYVTDLQSESGSNIVVLANDDQQYLVMETDPTTAKSLDFSNDNDAGYKDLIKKTLDHTHKEIESVTIHREEAELFGQRSIDQWAEIELTEEPDYDSILQNTVDEVKTAVEDGNLNPDQLLNLETEGKNRTTLTSWLERQDTYEPHDNNHIIEAEVSAGLLYAAASGVEVQVAEDGIVDEEVIKHFLGPTWQYIPASHRNFKDLNQESYEAQTSEPADDYEEMDLEDFHIDQEMKQGPHGQQHITQIFWAELNNGRETLGLQVQPGINERSYKDFLKRTGHREEDFKDGVLDEVNRHDIVSLSEKLLEDTGIEPEIYAEVADSGNGEPLETQGLKIGFGDELVDVNHRAIYSYFPAEREHIRVKKLSQQDVQVQGGHTPAGAPSEPNGHMYG